MAYKCSVKGCKPEPDEDTNIRYHKLRKTEPENVKESWREFCQTDRIQFSVCSRHFTNDDYATSEAYRKYYPNAKQSLKPGAIPSLRSPSDLIDEAVKIKRQTKTPSLRIQKTLSHHTIRTAKKQHEEMKRIVQELLNESDTDSSSSEMLSNVDALEEALAAHIIKPIKPSASTATTMEYDEAPLIEMAPELVPMELEPETLFNPLENESVPIKMEEVNELFGQIKRLKNEKLQLKQECSVLRSNNEQLRKIKRDRDSMEKILRETFSQNELDLLLKRKAHVVWRRKEMEGAFLMWYMNKTCYRYLRRKKRYPLPSSAAILKWANQYGISLKALEDIEPDSE